MFQAKFVEKIKIYIVCSKHFFFENHAFLSQCGKNMVELDRQQRLYYAGRKDALCVLNH